MLALVSRPPVKTPSASPARSKSLISSPCSRMIWPISPSPGTPRCRAVASLRNFRDPDTAPNTPVPPVDTSKRAEPSCRNVSRSSSGSPSSSQMTRNGTGNAKRRHQVDDAVGRLGGEPFDLVELGLDDRGDPRPQPLEPAHRELGRQQPPQPGVVGRVGEAQPADVAVGGRAALAHERPDVVAVAAGVGQHRARLLLAGDHPDRHARGTTSASRPARGTAARRAARSGRRRCAAAARTASRGPCRSARGRCRPRRRRARAPDVVPAT